MKQVLVFLAVFLLVMSTNVAAETLQLRLKKGDRFQTETTTNQLVIQQMNGAEIESRNQTRITLGFTVLEKTEAEVRIQMAFEHIHFEQTSPMGTNIYDSREPVDDSSPQLAQMARMYGALLNSPLVLVLDAKTGSQQEILGWEAFVEAVVTQIGVSDDKQRETLSKLMKQSVQDQIVSSGTQGLFPPIFNRELLAGTSWQETQTVSMMSDMNITTTYTVTDLSSDAVTLEMTSSLGTAPDAEPVDMGMMKLIYELSGSQTGTLKLDLQTGWVMASTVEHKMEGSMEPVGQGFKIPIQVSGSTELTSIRK